MQTVLLFSMSFVAAYMFFLQFSHPAKKKHRVPHVKLRNIELLPNVRIHIGKRTYHFHHWLVLGVLALSAYAFHEELMRYVVVKGATLGGILQGLRYPDRFKFRFPRELH